jgi:hypothetical protein
VIDLLTVTLKATYADFHSHYLQIAQIIFFGFLGIQVLCLTYFRSKLIRAMRDDVLKSRGILNLVPESFFKDHEDAVEKVIKTMKK